MRLAKGSRVIIVGGGPAGSFSALELLRLSEETRLELEVVIFEARDFNRPGPGGCNKCAGILSSTFLSNLEAFGLHLPAELIQAELDTYILHLGETPLPIHSVNASRRIVSVYRGSGPRWGKDPYPRSFDDWLLNKAIERGAILRRSRVQTIQPGAFPIVVTPRERLEADLVVVATGVNSSSPLPSVWGYEPPRLEVMAQDEVLINGEALGSNVHIFFTGPSGLFFGCMIPKGRYANVSLLGKDLPDNSVAQFLSQQDLIPLITESPSPLCGCSPKIAVTAASHYFNDRMVVVGDAAVTRLYKDGIGTAFITAMAAMRTAVFRGISRQDFSKGYHPICHRLAIDNRFGQILFRLWASQRNSPLLINAWKEAILSEALFPAEHRVHERVLWGMFTGEESYRKILFLLFSLPSFWSFLHGMVKTRSHK